LELLDALILGIIQGITEFLPVSSSGHLELAKSILGAEALAEQQLSFTVVLHFATALSTMVIFRKDIGEIILGLFNRKDSESRNFAVKIVLSMIPAVVIGLFFEEALESLFSGQVIFVGSMLWVTGGLLYIADRSKDNQKKVSYSHAVIIGVAQGIAMLPGISRSGATIATAVLLKVDKSKAARFSFLMVIPLIFGKVAKDLLSGTIAFEGTDSPGLIMGFCAAFVSGLLACQWMLTLVKKAKLFYFAIYCLCVGSIAIILGLINN
jgi:undecaprenyl-diphosphatase